MEKRSQTTSPEWWSHNNRPLKTSIRCFLYFYSLFFVLYFRSNCWSHQRIHRLEDKSAFDTGNWTVSMLLSWCWCTASIRPHWMPHKIVALVHYFSMNGAFRIISLSCSNSASTLWMRFKCQRWFSWKRQRNDTYFVYSSFFVQFYSESMIAINDASNIFRIKCDLIPKGWKVRTHSQKTSWLNYYFFIVGSGDGNQFIMDRHHESAVRLFRRI